MPERRSVAVDEEAAVLVDGRRQRAAEHRAEHRVRIARQSGARRRVALAADVQPDYVTHRRTQPRKQRRRDTVENCIGIQLVAKRLALSSIYTHVYPRCGSLAF